MNDVSWYYNDLLTTCEGITILSFILILTLDNFIIGSEKFIRADTTRVVILGSRAVRKENSSRIN